MLYANTEVQISKMTMLLNILLLRRVKVLSILKKSNNTHQLASRRKFIILTKKTTKAKTAATVTPATHPTLPEKVVILHL